MPYFSRNLQSISHLAEIIASKQSIATRTSRIFFCFSIFVEPLLESYEAIPNMNKLINSSFSTKRSFIVTEISYLKGNYLPLGVKGKISKFNFAFQVSYSQVVRVLTRYSGLEEKN